MYLRLTTVRRASKTYRYAQLVESYRGEGGTPTNRVVASLGALDDVAIQNLRAALAASRDGRALVVPEQLIRAQVHETLRYLDLAVLLRLWREVGLGELIEAALPRGEKTVPPGDVIAALVLQRCVAPGSKLAAERWYPTTALPELQAMEPDSFNNTRVHRALAALDEAEVRLKDALPDLLKSKEGAFTALFIDATDTWFVGEGPPLAQKGRDKEGLYRRRVGIVMLCDQRGYPLRWHTLDGRYHDPTALLEMAREAAALPWVKGVPVAMDRAAGHAGATEKLHEAGMLYLTALPDSELMSSGVPIPEGLLDSLQQQSTLDALRDRLLAAGFTADTGDRYVLDLGVFEKSRSKSTSRTSIAVSAIAVLEAFEAAGAKAGLAAAALKVTPQYVRRHAPLTSLTTEVRSRILAEKIDRLGLADLLELARAAPSAQMALLETMCADSTRSRHTARQRDRSSYPARAVLVCSPHRLLEDRRKDEENVAEVKVLVEDVNRRLHHPSNRRTDGSALAEVEHRLRRVGLGSVLSTRIEGVGTGRCVVLSKDDAAWAQRRQGDGINVILAHPDVRGTAPAIVAQYFAKDAIEKDFQTIKSMIDLRPVHHRSDPKVRAHVTLCVLALLLVRLLEARVTPSAARTLETLEAVRLNILNDAKGRFYTVTRPPSAATALLTALGMSDLADDAKVCNRIRPR